MTLAVRKGIDMVENDPVSKSLVDFFNKNDVIMNTSLEIFVNFWFNALKKDLKILDCGCGMGYLIKKLKEKGFKNVVGIELNEQMAQKAEKYTGSNIINADITDLSKHFNKASMDVLIFSDIIHHIASKDAWRNIFNQSAEILKKGGLVYIREPYPTIIMKTLFEMSKHKIFYIGFLKDRLKGYVLEREMHDYFFREWISVYKEILKNSGLKIESEFTGPIRRIIVARKI